MLKTLNPSPAERLRSRFHDHPLLLTCEQTFRHYMASMELFDFTVEELFVEVADVLDTIFSDPTCAPKYLQGLWDELKIKMKSNARTTSPQKDLDMVCGVLFYVVAATLSLHWREYYNTELVSVLRSIVEKRGLFSGKEEQEQIISNLCSHAEGLDKWINEYDDSEVCLSDEIEEALAAKQPKKKEEKKFIPIGQTFTKSVQITDVQLRIIGQRLSLAKKLDSSCSAENWEKLFSGVDSRFTINWLGHPGELRDLFDMLTKKRDGSNDGYLSPHYGYQKIVQSHFTDKNGEYFTDLRKQKSIEAFKPIIDDCEFFIQNYTEQLTDVMKQIIQEHWSELKEFGYVFDTNTYKREGMNISNRRH